MPLEMMSSREAELISVAAAVVVVLGVVVWAQRPGQIDRRLALGVAAGLTVVIGAIYMMALAFGWWAGAYFETPVAVQASVLMIVTLPVCVAWLAGYQWLADHARQPLQIAFAISLLIVLAVAVAHRMNIGQGAILVGPDLAVVWQAALGLALLWLPVLLYEALRRGVERVTLP